MPSLSSWTAAKTTLKATHCCMLRANAPILSTSSCRHSPVAFVIAVSCQTVIRRSSPKLCRPHCGGPKQAFVSMVNNLRHNLVMQEVIC